MEKLFRVINNYQVILYFNEKGQRHRNEGPAMIWPDGSCAWYKNGELYRKNGPLTIRLDGTQQYRKCIYNPADTKDGLIAIFPDHSRLQCQNGIRKMIAKTHSKKKTRK